MKILTSSVEMNGDSEFVFGGGSKDLIKPLLCVRKCESWVRKKLSVGGVAIKFTKHEVKR